MTKCFSLIASLDRLLRYIFRHAGLKSIKTDLGDGTTMHCWVPKTINPTKPNLLLIHGTGANAMWQWGYIFRPFISRFNVYIPDLLFYGESFTTRPERSEEFQAQCLMKLMEIYQVEKMSLIGVSYGGFVGYSLAAQFPEAVEKAVLCCPGVCMEKDLKDGLLVFSDMDDAISILLPQTPEKFRSLMKISFLKPPNKFVPSWLIRDAIEVMYREGIEEKRELARDMLKDRCLCNLPKITQPTLVVWGEHDQIFPLELGHKLKRHIGENAELVVIKNAGHAVHLEKTKEFLKCFNAFIMDDLPVHGQDSSRATNQEKEKDI